MTKKIFIRIEENGASWLDPTTFKNILQNLSHTTQLLEKWITTTSNLPTKAEFKVVTSCKKENSTTQNNILDLKLQV